jgi:uncharacterized surface protein with fasciclin (FAS1) repeats
MQKVVVRILQMVAVCLVAVLALTLTSTQVASAAKPSGNTIVDKVLAINAQSGEFSTLIAALQAADPIVLRTLSGRGQFTVFAPNNAAFAKIPAGTLNSILANKPLLTKILLYHVTFGRRDAEDVLESRRIRMLFGGFLRQNGGVLTDNLGRTANIIAPDAVKASNGIVHVIDTVVLPAAP